MSDLKNHVTSRELSKKLKDLGVKQESLFYWAECTDGLIDDNASDWHIIDKDYHDTVSGEWGNCHRFDEHESYSAFLASELGEMLDDASCPDILHKILDDHIDIKNETNTRANLICVLIINDWVNDGWKKKWLVTNEQTF